MTDEISEELIEQMRKNEKLVIRIAEILTLNRPLLLGAFLIYVWGLFGFAYSVEAGFFASICLIICAVYVLSILWALFGTKLEPILFKELEDRSGVPSIEECAKFVQKFLGDGSVIDKIAESSNSKLLIVAGVCFALAIFFKFVKPFWFNLIAATALILAIPVYTFINKQKSAPAAPKSNPPAAHEEPVEVPPEEGKQE